MIDRFIGVGALQGVHCLRQLTVQIPAIGCIDGSLQASHFFHERIEISIRISHFRANFVKTIHFGNNFAKSFLNVFFDGFCFIEWRFLLEQTHRIAT